MPASETCGRTAHKAEAATPGQKLEAIGRLLVDGQDTYTQFISYLDQHGVPYRLIDHAPEGRTELVSAMRGNALSQAAKCIVLMVKIGKKVTRYVLAVVPGDMRVDLAAVKALLGGTYVAFASQDIAERLAGSVAGTILPFSFHPELELVVDHALLENDELYFNAARLDRSIVLKASDYVELARPRPGRIAQA
jgi:Ala-tRNA(Pro) deacylase